MVAIPRYEKVEIDRGIIGLVNNEALLVLWQSKSNDALTGAQRNRVAGAALDRAARDIFAHLDRETSLKWEDLNQITNTNWPDAARAAALLVWANLCQPGPTRIRLTETGISILNESVGTSID